MKNKEGKDVTAARVPVAPGSKIELFRVIYIGGEGIRVEIQGFHTRDPGEMGAALAQTADILSAAMYALLPEGEIPRDVVLSVMVGAMVSCLVRPIEDEIDTDFQKTDFRGEPSKKGH
jgi:hypothetical protein